MLTFASHFQHSSITSHPDKSAFPNHSALQHAIHSLTGWQLPLYKQIVTFLPGDLSERSSTYIPSKPSLSRFCSRGPARIGVLNHICFQRASIQEPMYLHCISPAPHLLGKFLQELSMHRILHQVRLSLLRPDYLVWEPLYQIFAALNLVRDASYYGG